MIPAELRERKQWVVWRTETRNARPTKVPYRPAEPKRRADSTAPATWGSYDQAVAASDGADGIGFVFSTDDPYCGIDLDVCVKDGELHPAADEIRQRLGGYWELSPSKTGIHVVVKASVTGSRHRTSKTPWGDDVEVYDRDRFFAITGDGHGEIRDAQDALDTIIKRYLPPRTKAASNGRPAAPCSADDRELLERAFAASNGAQMRALYGGDIAAYGDDHSAADLALIGGLAFWTGPDPTRLDALFRSSGLCREKWTDRDDYRERTIDAALSSRVEFFDWSRNGASNAEPASAQPKKPQSKSTVTRADKVKSKRVRWAWKGFLPIGYLTIQTGETKLGKSTFFARTAAELTHGRLPGEFESRPQNILIVAVEDSREDLWKPRLLAAGADLERVSFIDLPQTWNVRDGMQQIHGALDEFPATLVFLDAVMEHLPESKGGENANSAPFIRRSLRPFADVCQQREIAGVISTHPPKGKLGGFADAFHGSGAFTQLSRSCLLFGWHPDDDALPEADRRRVLLRAAGNIGRDPGALSFKINGKVIDLDDGERDEIGYACDIESCEVTPRDLLRAERSTAPSDAQQAGVPKVDILADRIRAYLADGDWHPSIQPELIADGYSNGTIQMARKRVARVHKAQDTAGGWEWRLLHSSNSADRPTDRSDGPRPSVTPGSVRPTDRPENGSTNQETECQGSSTMSDRSDGLTLCERDIAREAVAPGLAGVKQ